MHIALLAGLAACLVAPEPVHAQANRAEQPVGLTTRTTGPDRPQSWVTTTTTERAPVRAPTPPRVIATGALPQEKPGLPKGSVAGGSHSLSGIASFYWQDQKTASGERFDKMAMTAAHKTLPFGTRVRVTNVNNGQSVVVRINDRGPFKGGRVIDLSYAAAGAISMRDKGLAPVKIQVVN